MCTLVGLILCTAIFNYSVFTYISVHFQKCCRASHILAVIGLDEKVWNGMVVCMGVEWERTSGCTWRLRS